MAEFLSADYMTPAPGCHQGISLVSWNTCHRRHFNTVQTHFKTEPDPCAAAGARLVFATARGRRWRAGRQGLRRRALSGPAKDQPLAEFFAFRHALHRRRARGGR